MIDVSLLQDILSPHSVVRFDQTRAQPLLYKYYSEFINKCLDMNMNGISNKNVFSGCKFNINKLVLNEQRKINKLISFGGGVIINNILRESEECEYYLICSTISSSEYESIELDANIICVSIIYIYECLKKGILFNRDICISYLPQILRNQQTNSLFDNITICISQFDNHLFERYIIQSLLYDTNATYSKTFHAKRCDILICNHLKGPKYKAANENNVPIVNFLWLIDSIKNGKQMDYNKYKLLSNNKINKQKRKSNVLGDVFGEGLLTAVNNCDENNDLCSPALASIVPPKNNNNNKENIITIDDDVIVLIIQWMILQILVQII